jgi:predicted nucleic acid-binding protein
MRCSPPPLSAFVGGGIYDAMLAHCALKAQAETIYSWNGRHYAQCGPEVTRRLRTP